MGKHSINNSLKTVAIILAAMIIGGSLSVLTFAAVTKKNSESSSTTDSSETNDESNDNKISKDETVYVLANSDGSVKKIIVSDWIKNKTGSTTVNDAGTLNDVKNVKGDESYKMNSDNMRVWDANGSDIYSQGISDQSLPVDLSVTYKLDGENVSSDKLAGKSGKVAIRFDYKNNQYENVEIDGKQQKVYVPFVMLTGMLLDSDAFTNVEVTNGKVISDGDHTAVVGFAMPGLQDNLNISKDKFDIPDYVEITADVKDFELDTTVTLATNNIFNELDLSGVASVDDLKSKMTTLTDSMKQLMDGSSQLYDGLGTLLNKSKELIEGVDKLATASKQVSAGANKLSSGANDLNDGVTVLKDILAQLTANNLELDTGLTQLTDMFLKQTQAQMSDNGITIDTLTASNYKQILDDLINSPTDTQKQELIDAGKTTLNQVLVDNGVPSNFCDAVTYMLYESISPKIEQGKSITDAQNEAMAEITPVLKNAVFALTANSSIPDTAIDGDAFNAAMAIRNDTTFAGLVAKISMAIASNSTGNAVDYIAQAVPIANDANKLLTANGNVQTENGIIAINKLRYLLAQNTVTDAIKVLNLCTGLQAYIGVVQQISDNVNENLVPGMSSLKDGSKELADGAAQLADGTSTLQGSTPALEKGVKDLYDGSMQLSDGLKEFNKEGVQKLVDLVDGDLGGIVTRLKATIDVSKDYKSFTGIDDGQDGNVKFIYKTDEIVK